MSDHRQLYQFNHARMREATADSTVLLGFERRWIAYHLNAISPHDSPDDLLAWRHRLAEMIDGEQRDAASSARYVAEHMSLDELRIVVQEFAVDALTAGQAYCYVLPRLTLEAQMPMLRIMLDALGAGNLKRAHGTLYADLLRELDMPTELASYCERVEPACFAWVNLLFWLSLRADDPSYFAGAIAYLEARRPALAGDCMRACKRLGIRAHDYYRELHRGDALHALESQHLLRAMHAADSLDLRKAWQGARLASCLTRAAFEAAVAKAREQQSSRCAVAANH